MLLKKSFVGLLVPCHRRFLAPRCLDSATLPFENYLAVSNKEGGRRCFKWLQ